MKAVLLALLLTQAGPGPKGFATGIVRSANGTPASGVRVYAIPAGDPNVAAIGATVFESLAQTDASGRYRLEIPVGRYYIAVGSVSSPTYFPDTASVASARAISITAGSTVESVDFSRYTAAALSPAGAAGILPPMLPPGSTGVLSGVVRNSDGTGASGVTVTAVPASILNSPVTGPVSSIYYGTNPSQRVLIYQQTGGAGLQAARTGGVAVTDNQGQYRIESLAANTYNIMAGFSDSPVFYPGTGDIQAAAALVTTATTNLTALDFALPPPSNKVSIRGRVSAIDRQPVGGATLNLQRLGAGTITATSSFLPVRSYRPITTGGDGTFEIPDVIPGKYALQARLSGTSPLTKSIDVAESAVEIDFDFSVNVLSGRIVWEDGSPISGSDIREVAVSTISNPNFVATTLLPVSNNGAFSGVIESGDYRFYISSLPDGYVVRAMTSGSVDLTKDPIHVVADVPTSVDIRVAKVPGSAARVRGRILDAVTGAAPVTDRLELCCFKTGPFERLSTAVLPDGSFDFSSVPPGSYTADLRGKAGQTAVGLLNRKLEIGDQQKSGLLLAFASQLSSVTANVTFEDGTTIPSTGNLALALLISPGSNSSNRAQAADVVSIPMGRLLDKTYWTPFPAGVLFTISVANLPEGYKIKSISGPGNTSAVSTQTVDGGLTFSAIAPGVISIVLQRTPAR